MIYEFVYNGETKEVEVRDGRTVMVADGTAPIELDYAPDGRLFVQTNGRRREIVAVVNGDKTFVDIDGILYEFATPSDDAGGAGGGGGVDADPSKIFAPMPGKVVKIMVAEGDMVEAKQHLAIVEAMKMENIIVAKAAGKVSAVHFAVGDKVDTDNPIIELELPE